VTDVEGAAEPVEPPPPAAAPAGPAAIGALVVTLSLGALRNRWRRRLARLRKPRYALALLAGAAYLYFVILRQTGQASMGSIIVPWAETLTALGFTLLAATWWLAPSEMGALAFTPAEAHLLFPAPVTRRALLVWKVLRAQGTILISTVLWVVVLRGGATTGGWMRALALWGMFSTIHLHRLAVQLAHAARRERHDGRVQRGWKAPLVLAAMGVALVASVWAAREMLAFARTSAELGAALGSALEHGPAAWALAPARAAVGPLFAIGAESWLPRMGAMLAVLVAHYAWVLGRDVPFEESALAASTALAERVSESQRSGRRGRRGRPVAAKGRWVSRMLGASGPAALAITWKNVLGWVRSSRPGPVIAGALVFGVINVLISGGEMTIADLLMPMAVAFGVLLVLFGPGIVRADIRQDLQMLEIMRGWPLSGRAVFGGEIAASALLLLALQLGYALLVAAAAFASGRIAFDVRTVGMWGAGLVVGLAALDLAHLSLYNLVAVLFPDWVRPDRERMGGIEATGQGMLLFFALLVALLVLLLPPLVAGLATALIVLGTDARVAIAQWEHVLETLGAAPVLAAVVTASVVLLVETMGIVWWGGRVLDRMEPLDTK
jgi:ABC-2 type transport system permease protein